MKRIKIKGELYLRKSRQEEAGKNSAALLQKTIFHKSLCVTTLATVSSTPTIMVPPNKMTFTRSPQRTHCADENNEIDFFFGNGYFCAEEEDGDFGGLLVPICLEPRPIQDMLQEPLLLA
jgi:hypothetical protein